MPQFSSLERTVEADVCIIGGGIAGISTAYELVDRNKKVVLLDARHILSGESGRTSGHLANALDDGYTEIAQKHGSDGARVAADSHTWALNRVGEIAKQLNINCEFRYLPGYEISQYNTGGKGYKEEIEDLKNEVSTAEKLGLPVHFDKDLAVGGWDGEPDQRGGAVFAKQAAFHPTKWICGVLEWLKKQPNFEGYADTRALSVEEGSLLTDQKRVTIKTEPGYTITTQNAVLATCVPVNKLTVIAQMTYNHTYCIAIRVPKGYVENCLLYDQADAYKYVRLTACDDNEDYMIFSGCDHKVGQEPLRGT